MTAGNLTDTSGVLQSDASVHGEKWVRGMCVVGVETESVPKPLFGDAEVKAFQADDALAGRVLGTLLSMLFIYTFVVMVIVTLWTLVTLFGQ